MAGLPNFPIAATVLSNNVSADRYTLVVNTMAGNASFPTGQYVFYSKNNSLWYKYKTVTTSWTSELLYIKGASQSNTKFDDNGYPMTAYVDANGLVKFRYYINGYPDTVTLAVSGTLPTVITTPEDTYVFWVPPNYNGNLYWAQDCSRFAIHHLYPITMPGEICSMQIQLTPSKKMLFSFTIDDGNGKKVYVAFTEPAAKFMTYDLTAFLQFMQGMFETEEFVVAEDGHSAAVASVIAGFPSSNDLLAIADSVASGSLIYVENKVTISPEYFIIAQKSDMEIVTNVIISQKLQDNFGVNDNIAPGYGLVFKPDSKTGIGEYFVVSEVSKSESIALSVQAQDLTPDSFEINEGPTNFQTQFIQNISGNVSEIFGLFDNIPQYIFTLYEVPRNPKNGEYFVMDDNRHSYTYPASSTILSVDANDEDPDKAHFMIFADDKWPDFNLNVAVSIDSAHFTEGFLLNDKSTSFVLTALIDANFNNNEINIDEYQHARYVSDVGVYSSRISEKLQLHESSNTILLYADTASFDYEMLNISTQSVSVSGNNAKQSGKFHDSFMIDEGLQTETYLSDISLDIIKDVRFQNTYGVPHKTLAGFPLVTFLSYNNNVPSYYYVLNTSYVYYPGPSSYNINVSEPKVTYVLSPIRN